MKTLFPVLIALSCSNLSSNRAVEGEFYLREGKIGEHRWDKALIFKKISWYTEMTLLYDILYTKLPEDSPFWHLFSDDEKKDLKGCSESFVVMSYELDPERMSDAQVENFVEQASFEKMALASFRETLATHPDFRRHFLHRYDIYALCRRDGGSSGGILLNFPHFDPKIMN